MKKILFISPTGLGNGGVQAVIMSIVRKLHTQYTFDIICNVHQDYYKNEFESYGGKVFYVKYNYSKFGRKIDFYLRYNRVLYDVEKIIKYNGPYTAIHCNAGFESAIYLKAAKEMGVKNRIVHSHNTKSHKKRLNKLYYLYVKQYQKMINKLATSKIGCSRAACQYLYGDTDYKVIFNAIDLDKFNKDLYFNNRNKTNKIIFLNVGRYSYQKNQLFLLEIFNKYLSFNQNAMLILVGFGPKESEIRTKIKELHLDKYVNMLPHDANIPQVMSESDYFIFPSNYEGLGIVVVEAQAMGLHCFVSEAVPPEANLGSCTQIDLKCGIDGWASIINSYIEKNNVSKTYVDMSNYDINKVIIEYEKIYRLEY